MPDERATVTRHTARSVVLALTLVPGFAFGLLWILQSASHDTPLWILVVVRVLGVLLIAAALNAALALAKGRKIRGAFALYGGYWALIFTIAVVLVARGGRG